MHRRLAACLLLSLVVPAGSAPRLKDGPGVSYFPTNVGDRWVIEMRYPTGTEEYTEEVTDVENKDGALIISIGREVDGKLPPQRSQIQITDKGIYRMSLQGSAYDAPYRILKLPLKPGEAWTSEASSGGAQSTTFKYRAMREEDVEVPAGKFRAFRIEVDIDTRGRSSRSAIWYGPGVGIVKMEHDDPAGGYVRVLKSFRPGRK